MKKILTVLLVLVVAFSAFAQGTQEKAAKSGGPSGTVVVYSPHDADPLAAGVALFEKAYPNIKVQVVAAGTGELAQRVITKTTNPQYNIF